VRPARRRTSRGLIETEYIPQLAGVEGVISCTLVHSGRDEVTSLGVFTSEPGAAHANALAQAWAKERLAGLGAAPLEARDGEVLLHGAAPG
jgi:hypothetical protein